MGTLHEDMCTFVIFHSILLRMRNISDKVVKKTKTKTSCSITFFPKFVPFMSLCGK